MRIEMVHLFDIWSVRPKYHAYGSTTDKSDLTVCGLVMYSGGRDYVQARLRLDHAAHFAVPCRKCFEDAA